MSFQISDQVLSAANFNHQKKIDGRIYIYHKIKQSLLFNMKGLIKRKTFTLATPERAVLDILYFGLKPILDNPDKINRVRLGDLVNFYPKSIRVKLNKLYDKKIF